MSVTAQRSLLCRALKVPRRRGTSPLTVALACLLVPACLLATELLVARKYDGSKKRGPGRPLIAGEIQGLILEMARDNPGWGYTRIRGALENLGCSVGRNTIKRILLENEFDPAGFRGTTWSTFLRA